jgi:hypothetical protein
MHKLIIAPFLLGILSGTETLATAAVQPLESNPFHQEQEPDEAVHEDVNPHLKSEEKCNNYGSC